MKNKTRYSQLLSVIVFFVIATTGCELAGLELQQPYEYDYNAGMYSNETHKTAWEFIQSRPDLFSIMQEGIEYAGLQDTFNMSGCTYILLTNTAFEEGTKGYFVKHTYPDPNDATKIITPNTLVLYSVQQVRELLLYHIVKGAWTWSNLPSFSTWYDTYANADTAKLNMYLSKERNPNIVFNNFEGHYVTSQKARTTNLKTSNGSYMHVLEAWMERPTRAQLNQK